MFELKSHKNQVSDEEVLFFGVSYIKDMRMLCLDFGRYTINLEWGFNRV